MNKMQEPKMRYRVPTLSWALVLVLHFSEAGSLSPKLVCVLTVPRALGTRGCAELPEAGGARSGVPGAGAAAAVAPAPCCSTCTRHGDWPRTAEPFGSMLHKPRPARSASSKTDLPKGETAFL